MLRYCFQVAVYLNKTSIRSMTKPDPRRPFTWAVEDPFDLDRSLHARGSGSEIDSFPDGDKWDRGLAGSRYK